MRELVSYAGDEKITFGAWFPLRVKWEIRENMKDFNAPSIHHQLGFMKTRLCNAFQVTASAMAVTAGLLAAFAGSALAQNDTGEVGPNGLIIIDPPLPCPTMSVEDVRESGITHQEVTGSTPVGCTIYNQLLTVFKATHTKSRFCF